ncbi:MAG: AI-2E family transporter [Chloroflexota bacterium]
MDMNNQQSGKLFFFALILALLTFTGYMMIIGRSILLPLVVAIVIWQVVVAMTEAIHQRSIGSFKLPYWLSGLLVFLGLFVILNILFGIFATEFGVFVEKLPEHQANLVALLDTLPLGLLQLIPAFSTGNIEEGLNTLLTTLFEGFSTYVTTVASSLAGGLSQASVVVVYVVFLMVEQGTYSKKLMAMFPSDEQRNDAAGILKSVGDNITDYVGIKTWISFLLGVAVFIVLWLLRVDHATVWAILSFLLNYIPFIGPIIAIIFPFLTAILSSTDWTWIIGVTVAVTLIQFIFGYMIEPRMMGNRLGVSPLVVLISLSIFGGIWGLTGMFLSVPLTVILIIVFGHFQSTRWLAILLSETGEIPEVDHMH